jgi:hypothetical protein
MSEKVFVTAKSFPDSNALKKQTRESQLQRVCRGVYAHPGNFEPLLAYALAHPQAIVTLQSALVVYGFSDAFPLPPFDLAFKNGSRNQKDPSIRQFYISSVLFDLGKTTYKWMGGSLTIYDRERLLIELFRFEKRLDRQTFKDAIFAYRELVRKGDFSTAVYQSYIEHFPNSKNLWRRFENEIT